MFEDAVLGVQAGVAAGMKVAAVPDVDADISKYSGASQILKSLECFDPTTWGLPPFK